MRVLIEGTGAPLGAAGCTRLKELALELPSARPEHEFVFLVRSQVADAIREVAPSARLWALPSRFERAALRLGWLHTAMPVLARGLRPDVVFGPFNIVPSLRGEPRPSLAVMVSNLAPYSEVALFRCRGRELWRNRALRCATDRSLRRAECVFVQSKQAFELLAVAGLREKAILIPQPTPPLRSRVEGSGDPDRTYLLVVGDLNSYKGVETVIEAIARLPARPELIVCGYPREPAYVRDLESLARQLEVADCVEFRGSVPHGVVLEMMRGATVCVASSRFENFSRVPGEAMAAGTPVVARDIPPYREACADAALYYDDAEILARHLERLLGDADFRQELGRAGTERARRPRSTTAPELIAESLERLAQHSQR